MKKVLTALKNSFSLSGTPQEEVRLASAPLPPRPPDDYERGRTPSARLAMDESSEDIQRRLNKALEQADLSEEEEEEESPEAERVRRKIDETLERDRERLAQEQLSEGATGEEITAHGQDVERTSRALGDAAQQASEEIEVFLPDAEDKAQVPPPPTEHSDGGASEQGAHEEEEPLPIRDVEESAQLHDEMGLKETPAQKEREREKGEQLDVIEISDGKGGTQFVQVLERDAKGVPTKTFKMDQEDPQEQETESAAPGAEHDLDAVRAEAEVTTEQDLKSPSSASEQTSRADNERPWLYHPAGPPARPGELPEKQSERERPATSATQERTEQFKESWFERLFPKLTAWKYEKGIEKARAPIMRAQNKLEEQREETERAQEEYENHRENLHPIRAAWARRRIERSRNKERAYEAEMRKFHGVMAEHSENLKRILRGTERKYRNEMRPYEVRAEAEKTRLGELRSLNTELSSSLEMANEELLELEEEGRSRQGLRRSREFIEARREVRGRMRSVERRLRKNEIEISRRNARFVEANAQADVWRDRINDLAERVQGDELEFDIPNPEEMRVSEFAAIPDYEVRKPAQKGSEQDQESKEIDTAGTEDLPRERAFAEFWNQLTGRENEKIDQELFVERVRAYLAEQGKEEFEEMAEQDLEIVLKQFLSERGVVRGPSWWKGKVARILRMVRNETV